MQVTLVNETKPYEFKVGDLFKAKIGDLVRIRMIIFNNHVYQAIDLNGKSNNHDSSIGLLMRTYIDPIFIGRLKTIE